MYTKKTVNRHHFFIIVICGCNFALVSFYAVVTRLRLFIPSLTHYMVTNALFIREIIWSWCRLFTRVLWDIFIVFYEVHMHSSIVPFSYLVLDLQFIQYLLVATIWDITKKLFITVVLFHINRLIVRATLHCTASLEPLLQMFTSAVGSFAMENFNVRKFPLSKAVRRDATKLYIFRYQNY